MRWGGVTLTYDNQILQDGTCAQLQRILGISGLAYLLNVGYLHSNIDSIDSHSCDPFQTEGEISSYLKDLNHEFYLPSTSSNIVFDEIIYINYATPKNLFKHFIRAFLRRRKILIKILSPYWFTDRFPFIYSLSIKKLKNRPTSVNNKRTLIVHLRYASIMSVIPTPKYATNRVLSESYYINIIEEIKRKDENFNELTIRLHVDSPRDDEYWNPPKHKIQRDRELGYTDTDKVFIKGFKVENSGFSKYKNVEVIYGVSPIDALEEMKNADYLITSLSSFSFVGALLNKSGKVFVPSTFVSKELKKWHSI